MKMYICPQEKKKLKRLKYTHESSLVTCENGTMSLTSDLFLLLQTHGPL